MYLQPIAPLVYELVEKTTEQTTVSDVLMGAFTVVGGLLVSAVLLGVLLAGTVIAIRRLTGRSGLNGGGRQNTKLGLDSSSLRR